MLGVKVRQGYRINFERLKGKSTKMQGKHQDSQGAISPATWLDNLTAGIQPLHPAG